MYYYHCLNSIAGAGLDEFTEEYAPTDKLSDADAVLVRSASMQQIKLGGGVKAIARAGAGVNNIPLEKCAEQGIVVFNTPGANANGVKELVIAGMLLASRDILGGIRWVEEHKDEEGLVRETERAKKAFSGCEIKGKRLGVIGLGAIGAAVANAGIHLGMEVRGYDPYMSVASAWRLSEAVRHAKTQEEIFKSCDYITIHVPATERTRGMINADALRLMKRGAVVLNFARDVLAKEEDIREALLCGQIKNYVTDFPTPLMARTKGAVVIPHLGASTLEAEDTCARMAVRQLRDYLEYGNINNSVNYPNCDMGVPGEKKRLTLLHHNVPNMIGQFTRILARENRNIADMANKSKGGYAYTMIDIDSDIPLAAVKELERVPEVLRVRAILPGRDA